MTDVLHRGVIEVQVDGSGVATGVEKAKGALKSLEGAAGNAGAKLGSAMAGGATQAGKATDALDAVARRYMTTLEREALQAGKTRSEYHALRLAKLEALNPGISTRADPFLQQLREAEKAVARTGLSAKQTTAALRQVPSQFTDIIVSLQGGQSPMQVLLQQGGQLKDVFGGAGPAVRALGGYVASLINPLTVTAAAAGVLGYALYKGATQSKEFADSLVLTGNFAGQTITSFENLAQGIAASGEVSISAVREFGQALIATGEVGPRVLGLATEAATRYGMATGKSADEVARDFASMGQDVAKWAAEHNRQLNLVTAAQIEHTRVLQEQGRTVEAQEMIYQALITRLRDLEPNLGILDVAVRNATTNWARFWDAAAGLGRQVDPATRIREVQDQLNFAQNNPNYTPEMRRERGGAVGPALSDQQRAALNIELRARQQAAASASVTAATTAETAALNKQVAAGDAEIRNLEERGKAAGALGRELNRLNALFAAQDKLAAKDADYKPTSMDRRTAVFQDTIKRFEEKTPKGPKAPLEIDTGKSELEAQLADSKRMLDSLTGVYRNSESILEAVRSAGLVSEGEYYDAKRKFIADNALAVANAAIDQEAALELEAERLQAKAAKLKGNDAVRVEREIIDINRKIADSEEKRALATANAATQTELLNIRQAASLASLTRSYEEARIAAEQYLNSLTLQQDREVAALGTGRRGRDQAAGRNQITDRYQGQREQLEAGKRLLEFEGKFTEEARAQYDTRLAIINEYNARALASFDAYYARRLEREQAFNTGASDALNDYLDSVKNVAAETERLFGKAFSGLEDALLDFTKTGKLNFKSLAQSITDDLNRTIIRQNITGPLAEWLQGGLKTGEGAAGSITDGLRVLMGGKQSQGGPDVAQQGFLSLKTLGIDPATEALMRFTQAANSAQFGGRPSTSANQDAFSLDGVFTSDGSAKSLFDVPADGAKEFSSTLVSAKTGTEQFLDILKPASQALAGMGQAGSAAAFALQLLPGIIQSMQGSGGGGGFIGSLFSMFTGSANAAGGANAAGFGSGAGFGNLDLGGFLASGGPAEYGKAYMVGEQGRELFIPRTSGTVVPNGQTEKLMRGGNGGTVNQHFYVTGAVDKRTQGQVFSEAARGATMARARGTA